VTTMAITALPLSSPSPRPVFGAAVPGGGA